MLSPGKASIKPTETGPCCQILLAENHPSCKIEPQLAAPYHQSEEFFLWGRETFKHYRETHCSKRDGNHPGEAREWRYRSNMNYRQVLLSYQCGQETRLYSTQWTSCWPERIRSRGWRVSILTEQPRVCCSLVGASRRSPLLKSDLWLITVTDLYL